MNSNGKEIAASLTFEDVAAALEQSRWIYAKTMPECPHFYTLLKEWTAPVPFEAIPHFIRLHGYPEKFGKTRFVRLDVNNFKYWVMKPPYILINRAEIDRPEPYDTVASIYDIYHGTPQALAESRAAVDALDYTGGSVLDIGCGTGRLLDHLRVDNDYLGIDPSSKMLDILIWKHPLTETVRTKFESYFAAGRRFDVITGLFGAPSYIDPGAFAKLPSLLAPGGRFFLMFYKEDYQPEEHRAGLEIPHYDWRHAIEFLPEHRVDTLGNYMVIRS